MIKRSSSNMRVNLPFFLQVACLMSVSTRDSLLSRFKNFSKGACKLGALSEEKEKYYDSNRNVVFTTFCDTAEEKSIMTLHSHTVAVNFLELTMNPT